MPAAATLIAIRNAEQDRARLAEEASRARRDHATGDVSHPSTPQDLAVLQQRVDDLQARIQAYEVSKPPEPFITLNTYLQFMSVASMLLVVVLIAVLGTFVVEGWQKRRRGQRGG